MDNDINRVSSLIMEDHGRKDDDDLNNLKARVTALEEMVQKLRDAWIKMEIERNSSLQNIVVGGTQKNDVGLRKRSAIGRTVRPIKSNGTSSTPQKPENWDNLLLSCSSVELNLEQEVDTANLALCQEGEELIIKSEPVDEFMDHENSTEASSCLEKFSHELTHHDNGDSDSDFGKEDELDDPESDDDSDYQPEQSDYERSVPKKTTTQKLKMKLLKILPSSHLESLLPTPYICLGPEITRGQLDEMGIKYSKKFIRNVKFKSKTKGNKPKNINTPFACKDCDFTTDFNCKYLDHVRVHTGEKPFLCVVCETRFRTRSILNDHVRRNHPATKIKCAICQKEFRLQIALDKHTNNIHKDKRRQCDICKEIFAHETSLRNHQKGVHGNKNSHICHICGHGYPVSYLLTKHIKQHSDPNFKMRGPKRTPVAHPSTEKLDLDKVYSILPNFPCAVDGCGKSFITDIKLQFHVRKYHMTKEERKVKCQFCKYVCRDPAQLRLHIAQVHLEERPYSCYTCKQSFKTKKNLRRHEAGHSNPNWRPRSNRKPKNLPILRDGRIEMEPPTTSQNCSNTLES